MDREAIENDVDLRRIPLHLFPAYEGEEKLVNPDLWGKRLAEFLYEGLRRYGFDTQPPNPEDWGWHLPVQSLPFRMWIGCGHYQEYEDGYLCFIVPHKPAVWTLRGRIATGERISALQRAMDEVLTIEGVHGKKWWTHEAFNNPKSHIGT